MKLHFGCSNQRLKGHLNVDVRSQTGADLLVDLRGPLPFAPASVDAIVANDLLEHFEEWRVSEALDAWRDALKVGGRLKLRVPDVAALSGNTFFQARASDSLGVLNLFCLFGMVELERASIFGIHKWGYSWRSLAGLLIRKGFKVRRLKTRCPNPTGLGEPKLDLECWAEKVELDTVRAALRAELDQALREPIALELPATPRHRWVLLNDREPFSILEILYEWLPDSRREPLTRRVQHAVVEGSPRERETACRLLHPLDLGFLSSHEQEALFERLWKLAASASRADRPALLRHLARLSHEVPSALAERHVRFLVSTLAAIDLAREPLSLEWLVVSLLSLRDETAASANRALRLPARRKDATADRLQLVHALTSLLRR